MSKQPATNARWNRPRVARVSGDEIAPDLLSIVTERPKVNIRRLADVPADCLETTPVAMPFVRPRTWPPERSAGPWYEPFTDAYLLRLENAFIGDNVVFDADRYFSFGKWWLGAHDHSWELYRNVREVRHVERAISVSAWGGEAFQLFILEALPRLGFALDLMQRPGYGDLKIVSHLRRSKVAQWFWDALGLADRVIQKPINAGEGFVVHADEAFYGNYAPNLGHYGLHPRNSLRPVQDRLGVTDGTQQDLVLYLARRRGSHRCVANELELLARLKQVLRGTGLTLEVFAHSGDLAADRERVKRARLLIGPHGGALANMVFAQPGTHVIEFNPLYDYYRAETEIRPSYWGLAQAAGLDYWTTSAENFAYLDKDMVVPTAEIAAITDHLVAPTRRRAPARRKPVVRLFGTPGYRQAKRFTWTQDSSQATCDAAVMFNEKIMRQVAGEEPLWPGRRIGWIRESPAIAEWMRVQPWILQNIDRVTELFDVVLSADRSLCERYPGLTYHPAGANLPWPWIEEHEYAIYEKRKMCSMFASPKQMVAGHELRHRYAERLQDRLDLFGGACGSERIGGGGAHPDKGGGLLDYRFNVAMENCQVDLYYTEKLTDCFACGTIPVYWGADTIGELFDTDGILRLDDDFDPATLTEELYQSMLPAARNNLETLRDLELADDLLFRLYVEE